MSRQGGLDLHDEAVLRNIPALHIISLRREIRTLENLAKEEELNTVQRDALIESIKKRVKMVKELEVSLNALYDLDRDRENDPNLAEMTLAEYITLSRAQSRNAVKA